MRTLRVSIALLFPVLMVVSASAQGAGVLYNNGPVCPGYCHDAWQINGGYEVSDSFFVNANAKVTGFDFWTWEFPGDRAVRVQWSITSSEFGGTIYGSGTALVADRFEAVNEYGYDIDQVTVTGLNVPLRSGTYWLNLQNVMDEQHSPVYWDENSGEYCHSPGCPSSASDNQVGTIPSETFDIRGAYDLGNADKPSSPPEPTSAVWGSVLLGLAALKRILL